MDPLRILFFSQSCIAPKTKSFLNRTVSQAKIWVVESTWVPKMLLKESKEMQKE